MGADRRSATRSRIRLAAAVLTCLSVSSCSILTAFVELFSVRDVCAKAEFDGLYVQAFEEFEDLQRMAEGQTFVAGLIWSTENAIGPVQESGPEALPAVCGYYSNVSELRGGWTATSGEADGRELLRIALLHHAELATAASSVVRSDLERLYSESQILVGQTADLLSDNPHHEQVNQAHLEVTEFHASIQSLTDSWRFVDDQLGASANLVRSLDPEDDWGAEFFPEDLEAAFRNAEAMMESFRAL